MSDGKTFKEAYATLQKHAQALRSQQEPDIDNLTTIVSESVEAYKVCKERIDAVEKALEQALGSVQNESEATEKPQGRRYLYQSAFRTPTMTFPFEAHRLFEVMRERRFESTPRRIAHCRAMQCYGQGSTQAKFKIS